MNLLDHQLRLEYLYNKNQLHKRIEDEFTYCKIFDFKKYIISKDLDVNFGINLLVQMVIRKRCEPSVLIGLLANHFDTLQECSDSLYKAAEADLVDYDGSIFIIKYDVSEDVRDAINLYQYPLPFVIEPNEIKNNNDNGMYLNPIGSVILKNNHHNNDVCLDHINRMNRLALSLNMDVVNNVKNQWKNINTRKEDESLEDFNKRRKAFNKFNNDSIRVINEINDITDRFYLQHKYDKRGRTYCCGYHVSYQSNDWCKAIVQLADKELINA